MPLPPAYRATWPSHRRCRFSPLFAAFLVMLTMSKGHARQRVPNVLWTDPRGLPRRASRVAVTHGQNMNGRGSEAALAEDLLDVLHVVVGRRGLARCLRRGVRGPALRGDRRPDIGGQRAGGH